MIRAAMLLVLALGACVHRREARDPVLANPENYVGQSARVCGLRVDGANIVESYPYDSRRPGGISILHPGPLGGRQGYFCVEGVISRLGCATGPDICVDAAFDYAIRIARVVR